MCNCIIYVITIINHLLFFKDTEGYEIPDRMKVLYPYPLESLVSLEYVAYSAGNVEAGRLYIGKFDHSPFLLIKLT